MSEEEIIDILKNIIVCNKKQFEEIGTHILIQDDEMEAIERYTRPIPKGKRKE